MSDLTRAVHKDPTGLLAAVIALLKQFAIMQLSGGHSPDQARQMLADTHDLHEQAQAMIAPPAAPEG